MSLISLCHGCGTFIGNPRDPKDTGGKSSRSATPSTDSGLETPAGSKNEQSEAPKESVPVTQPQPAYDQKAPDAGKQLPEVAPKGSILLPLLPQPQSSELSALLAGNRIVLANLRSEQVIDYFYSVEQGRPAPGNPLGPLAPAYEFSKSVGDETVYLLRINLQRAVTALPASNLRLALTVNEVHASSVQLVGYDAPAQSPEQVVVLPTVAADFSKTLLLTMRLNPGAAGQEVAKLHLFYTLEGSPETRHEVAPLQLPTTQGQTVSEHQELGRLLVWLLGYVKGGASGVRPTKAELINTVTTKLPNYPAKNSQELIDFWEQGTR